MVEESPTELESQDREIKRLVQETKLEEAKAARLEAERKHAEQMAKDRQKSERRERRKSFSKMSTNTKLLIVLAVVAIIVVVVGLLIPSMQPKHQNKYYTDSDLEKVVDISDLSTVEYVYRGIAEREGWLFGLTDLRIKYEAHVRATFDMSQIEIHVDHEAKTITVTLPEPAIHEPELNENEFGYLPESAIGDLPDIIRLCKEDATNEVKAESQIKERAYESLKSTVKALTEPLIGDYDYIWELAEDQVQLAESEEVSDEGR